MVVELVLDVENSNTQDGLYSVPVSRDMRLVGGDDLVEDVPILQSSRVAQHDLIDVSIDEFKLASAFLPIAFPRWPFGDAFLRGQSTGNKYSCPFRYTDWTLACDTFVRHPFVRRWVTASERVTDPLYRRKAS